jgi:S-adenosylmethionine-dependent methyltransferase
MLDIAKQAAQEAGVKEKITLREADASQVASLFRARSFDIVLCHNLLEYVGDPEAVLRRAACSLRDSSSILSILVRNQAGEVFKSAILAGDLAAAENNLSAEWGHESLYGGKVRLFTPAGLQAMLTEASLTTVGERGVRVLSDYLPPQVSRSADYERIFELERKLGSRPDYAAVSRYTHYLARRVDSIAEDKE